ncbi:biosynthetic-type acetolactate synthase large subunit [Gottschalkiaceae bacterium SANA]|nr:biosynthetic-type acetolactate synthase large subunit [Gottschalkiaceae bacterium SANA]
MKGAEIVLEVFKRESVELMFGYPGGAVIPLYDALHRADDAPRHIRTVHEQNAVHAADGYARATGKPGVCIATSGPGASNTITGLATAYMDSVPLVVLTGQVPTALLGKDSFQELDITGITFSITKHNYLVRDVNDLAEVLTEAFEVASSGRPGPVLVDIPKDIFLAETTPDWAALGQAAVKEAVKVNYSAEIQEALAMIESAKRPVILAGGGVKLSEATKELVAFAEKTQIPVINTLMGLGTIDRAHALSLGMVGMHGFKHVNLAASQSDLILAIGTRFSDRVVGKRGSFGKNASIIHIDLDPTEFGKNVQQSLSIRGDVKKILWDLLAVVPSSERADWLNHIQKLENKSSDRAHGFTPANILSAINKAVDPRATVVTDVGQHQMWAAQFWDFKESVNFITSGGLGTMGFGPGAAMGASMANPDQTTVLITGDGSFRMSASELLTIAKHDMPILIAVMNNRALGMVRQWQQLFQDERYAETTNDEDMSFEALAAVYKIPGATVDTLEELEAVLRERKWESGPFLMDLRIENTHNVYPIVPPGKPIDQLITE